VVDVVVRSWRLWYMHRYSLHIHSSGGLKNRHHENWHRREWWWWSCYQTEEENNNPIKDLIIYQISHQERWVWGYNGQEVCHCEEEIENHQEPVRWVLPQL
jgi:hypothetical protein